MQKAEIKKEIRRMSNLQLVRTVNKIMEEKRNPDRSSRFVPESEFWRGNISSLKQELARRQHEGVINARAGKPAKRRGYSGLGGGSWGGGWF